jgi:actin related protein 2/3 complex subunit 1A/1B
MSLQDIHQLVLAPITAHAFNADRSQVAICPNTNEVHVYERSASEWKPLHVLKGVRSLD